jgi:hypothetical protein
MDQDEIDAMKEEWNNVRIERIRRFCTQQEIEHTPNTTKEELINILQRFGLHAYQAFVAPVVPPPVPAAVPYPRRARLILRDQGPHEEVTDYLKHADLFFALDHTEDELKVAHLIGKLTKEARIIVENLYHKGVNDYQVICEILLEQFEVSRFDRLVRFRDLKPGSGQNLLQYGAQLRAEYLKYILVSETDAEPMEPALLGALLEQLLTSIDPGISAQVRHKILDDPDLTWNDILKIAENYRQTHVTFRSPPSRPLTDRVGSSRRTSGAISKTFAGPSYRPSANRRSLFCEFHQRAGHSTEECHAKKVADEEEVSTPAVGATWQPKCFKCNQMGHYQRDCSQSSENAQPDRTLPESSGLAPKRQTGY